MTDYHKNISAIVFKDWITKKLVRYLPANSLIVMDNTAYHSQLHRKIPNVASTNAKIAEDIYFEEEYIKFWEFYIEELIKRNL